MDCKTTTLNLMFLELPLITDALLNRSLLENLLTAPHCAGGLSNDRFCAAPFSKNLKRTSNEERMHFFCKLIIYFILRLKYRR